MVKEDGTDWQKLMKNLHFKVIEFSKVCKENYLSHSRVFEDDEKSSEEAEQEKSTADTTKKTTKKMKTSMEKTTLGDITDLAALKDRDGKEGIKKKKTKKPKEDDENQVENDNNLYN